MLAAVLHDFNKLELEQVPHPEPAAPGTVPVRELGPLGIRVNGVSAGWIMTESSHAITCRRLTNRNCSKRSA